MYRFTQSKTSQKKSRQSQKVLSLGLLISALLLLVAACSPSAADTTAPATPSNLFVAPGDSKVMVNWTANSEADLKSYTLYWGSAADALNESKSVNAPDVEAEINGLINGTSYFVALDAVDKSGNASAKTEVAEAKPTAPDTTAPSILSTTPAEADTGVAVDAALIVKFSELMDASSVAMSLNPAVALAEASWSEDGLTAVFQPESPLAPNQSYLMTIEGKDTAGNALTGAKSFSFITANPPDTTAPTVDTNSPADAATGVASTTNISLSFSEPMSRSSVEAAFSVNPPVTCSFAWSADDTLLTCVPGAQLATSTAHTVSLANTATDKAGNALAAPHSFSFTTAAAPDTTAPTVTSTTPASSENGILRRPSIQISFSEPMDKASAQAAFQITSPSGFNSGVFSWNSAGTTMTFKSDTSFNYAQNVSWRVTTAAKDLAGNAMTADAIKSFKVRRQSTLKIYSTKTLDGSVDNTNNVLTAPAFIVPDGIAGDLNDNTYRRGFLDFDLSALPNDLIQITSANLSVRQVMVAGNPYNDLGKLLAQSVYYGSSLTTADFETPVLKTRQCAIFVPTLIKTQGFELCPSKDESRVLSDNASLDFKTITATLKVQDDWANRTSRANHSQYRLKFEDNVSTDAQGDFMVFGTGDAAADYRPYLEITFEHP
ncbi:MAG: Ig-like domain-containing protein [Trueperaceae bacterium]|nr:Ig-like domain-containing protein [Trueperaceae bacterium]